MKKKTIAVDFDGVLHQYSHGWKKGEIYDLPVEGSREAMHRLKERGFTIFIYSTRANKLYHKEDYLFQQKSMKEWLDKYDIPFDKIWTFGKPMADIYLDDRAITFRGNWDEALEEIDSFQVWNRK